MSLHSLFQYSLGVPVISLCTLPTLPCIATLRDGAQPASLQSVGNKGLGGRRLASWDVAMEMRLLLLAHIYTQAYNKPDFRLCVSTVTNFGHRVDQSDWSLLTLVIYFSCIQGAE